MLFHTYTFAIFFTIVYSGFLLLRTTRFWIHWLLAASYFFYGWWNPFYLLLLFYSTSVDYVSVKVSSICSQLDVLAFDHANRNAARRVTEFCQLHKLLRGEKLGALRRGAARFVSSCT